MYSKEKDNQESNCGIQPKDRAIFLQLRHHLLALILDHKPSIEYLETDCSSLGSKENSSIKSFTNFSS